jgi:hypothetical protein
MRRILPAAIAGTTLFLITTIAGAQQAPPLIEVTVNKSDMEVVGEESLSAGPTRLRVTVPGKAERAFVLFELKAGVTREEVERAAPEIEHPADAEKFGRFVASSIIDGGQTYETTLTLRDGNYVLIDLTRRPAVRDGFTVGLSPNQADPLNPDATITLEDYKFGGDTVLPRRGILRIENTGRRIHHALAFRLRRGVSGRRVVRQLRGGGEPRRAFAGQASALVELVSSGAVNDVKTSARRGRYVLVCFVSNSRRGKPHAQLGMVRAVRFR